MPSSEKILPPSNIAAAIANLRAQLIDAEAQARFHNDVRLFSLEEIEIELALSYTAGVEGGFKVMEVAEFKGKLKGTREHTLKLKLKPLPGGTTAFQGQTPGDGGAVTTYTPPTPPTPPTGN